MELVCVYDGHGIEQDEFDYACPSCGSTNTTPAWQCECCGEWFDWTEMNDDSLCVGCEKKLQTTDKGETNE